TMLAVNKTTRTLGGVAVVVVCGGDVVVLGWRWREWWRGACYGCRRWCVDGDGSGGCGVESGGSGSG
nr:hypothetical protein [Tanacetum cinerariifolium]